MRLGIFAYADTAAVPWGGVFEVPFMGGDNYSPVQAVRYRRILIKIYHQLTRTHKVLGAKQHGITVSSSFEIQPVFLHSSSLFCHVLWLLKLKDPKELVLRAIQGRGAQYYWM